MKVCLHEKFKKKPLWILFLMSETKRKSARDVCLQNLILRRKVLTSISLLIVISALVLQFLIYDPTAYQTAPKESVNDLVNYALQRQLFWGVVALSSFIGYFQFLVVVSKRISFSWLFRLIFLGFVCHYNLSYLEDCPENLWDIRLWIQPVRARKSQRVNRAWIRKA